MKEKKTHDYNIEGYECLKKTVRPGNNSSARIHVPPKHAGRRVVVIFTDPPLEEESPND